MKEIVVDPKAKALIFDLDGTLIDSMPLHFEAWSEATKEIPLTSEEFYSFAGMPAEKIFEILNKKYGTNLDPHTASLEKSAIYMRNIHKLKVIEPVIEIVKQYHGKLPMSIGTGGPGEDSREVVKSLGLDHYFDILVSKNDVEEGKPHPETFIKCAKAMDVEPTYCQVFEDGNPGLEAAKTAGMMSIDVREYL